MLAIARGAGETAPLLFTALFSNYWPMRNGHLNLKKRAIVLSVLHEKAGRSQEKKLAIALLAEQRQVRQRLFERWRGRTIPLSIEPMADGAVSAIHLQPGSWVRVIR